MVHVAVTACRPGETGVTAMCEGSERVLRDRITSLTRSARITILIHGYRFNPGHPDRDPARLLYAFRPEVTDSRIASWPTGLGYRAEDTSGGLCIGFGWAASAPHLDTLRKRGRTGFAQVYRDAPEAGRCLGALIAAIHRIAPERSVDLVAHSLGARVALSALPHLDRAPGRIILMGAAEYASAAGKALGAIRRDAMPEIYNITARGNDFYDAMFETFAPAGGRGDRAIGCGLPDAPPGWLDLQLDAPHVARRLGRRGVTLGPPQRRPCHWSFYTRAGAFCLYRAILDRRPGFDVESLRRLAGTPAQAPRWSGLRAGLLPGPPLDLDALDAGLDPESA